jgi:hypothetical protein
MAGCYSPPLPEVIYGVGIRTLVRLPSKETVTAKADLVISGAESTTIEVHDYFPAFYFERGWVGRRLDVIAALEMQSEAPEKPFPRVERVVYRHFMTGKTIERRRVRPARLVFALDKARRGIQTGIFTPEFLSGDLSRCRKCQAQEICIPAVGDIIDWFLPGEVDLVQRVNQIASRFGLKDVEGVRTILEALEADIVPLDLLEALHEERGWKHRQINLCCIKV